MTACAYFLWGILPLYWKMLAAINALHILAFRILFSLVLVSIILFARKNFSWILFFKNKKEGFLYIAASIAISFNWGFYIWAINSGHTIEASLGYYINPLIVIVLGMCVFKERLTPLQLLAFALAMTGVAIQTIFSGSLPWISLLLAGSFAIYALCKKTIKRPALETLGVETLIASPLGLFLLFAPGISKNLQGGHGISYLAGLPASTWFLLLLCGAITTLPLYLFAKGAKILPFSTVGFIQFISPTLNFLEGYFIFNESFPRYNFIVFGFIWTAALIYIVSLYITPGKKAPGV